MKTDAVSLFLAFTFFNVGVNLLLTTFYTNSLGFSIIPYTKTLTPINYILIISIIVNVLLLFYIPFGRSGSE